MAGRERPRAGKTWRGGASGKAVALGMRSRNGQAKAQAIPENGRAPVDAIKGTVRANPALCPALCTDEHPSALADLRPEKGPR